MTDKILKSLDIGDGNIYKLLPKITQGELIPIYGTAGREWSVGSGTLKYLNCICICENSVVIGNSDGEIYRSTDGKTFGPAIPVSYSAINGLFYHNGLLICGTDGDGLCRSSDEGITWTYIEQDEVRYADAPWVLNDIWFEHEQATIFSHDGITWSLLDKDMQPVCYADGLYIAIGIDQGLKYSTDLTTWTQSNVTSGDFYFVYYADGLFVACGSEHDYYSTDGKTWTQINVRGDGFGSVYYASGLWVAGGNNIGLYYSEDGKTWNQSNITSGYFHTVYYINGLWLAGSDSTGGGLYYSEDGKVWTQSNVTNEYCTSFCCFKNIALTCSNDNLYYSEPEIKQLESPDNGKILKVINGEWGVGEACPFPLINFSVGTADNAFQTVEGMTWEEWIASSYNTSGGNFTVSNGHILCLNPIRYIGYNSSTVVSPTDVIENGRHYVYI